MPRAPERPVARIARSSRTIDGMIDSAPAAFHVMAKPTGARCNLRCDYCFFLEKERLYPDSDFRMAEDVLQAYIAQTAQAQRVPQVTIAWQGGEPTLMGLDFFRRARAAEEAGVPAGMRVERTLQTNGVLLDDEWAAFLAENDYLVGLSLDGPRELHDAYRHDKAGNPVFDRVVAAALLLQRHGVEFNVMCTVNARNSLEPLAVYRFFRDELKARFIQFIPIVEVETPPTATSPGTVTDRSVRPEAYGDFLSAIFDEWIRHDVGEMFVQFFDGVLAAYVRGYSSLCVLRPTWLSATESPSSTTATSTRATISSTPHTSWATSPRRRSATSCAPNNSGRSAGPSRRRCRPTAASAPTCSPATGSAPRTAS